MMGLGVQTLNVSPLKFSQLLEHVGYCLLPDSELLNHYLWHALSPFLHNSVTRTLVCAPPLPINSHSFFSHCSLQVSFGHFQPTESPPSLPLFRARTLAVGFFSSKIPTWLFLIPRCLHWIIAFFCFKCVCNCSLKCVYWATLKSLPSNSIYSLLVLDLSSFPGGLRSSLFLL
jgi:hypothetical protein